MKQSRSCYHVQSLDRRLLLSSVVKNVVDSIGTTRHGVDHIDRPVITEKLPVATENSTQLKDRYGVGNPFEGEEPGNPPGPEYNTSGNKWPQSGLGNPVNITFSFANVLGGLSGLNAAQTRAAVIEALSLWSAVVPLRFTNVTDSGPPVNDGDYPPSTFPNIRFGAHALDGPNGQLSHGFLPPPVGLGGLAGDVHFDSAETWSNNSNNPGYDLIELATHEIGHALGLLDSGTSSAVMWPNYKALFDGPDTGFIFTDDIAGIQSIYGAGFGYVIDSGTLYLSGTESADVIYVRQSGSNLQVERGSFVATVPIAGISRIEVRGRGGTDYLRVESNAGIQTMLYGGNDNDNLEFSNDARHLSNITGYTYAYGGNGGADAVWAHDENNPNASTYQFDDVDLTRSSFGGAFYGSDVEGFILYAGAGLDTINIPETHPATVFYLDNSGGNDVVNIGNSANGVQDIEGQVQIENSPALTTLNINDSANPTGRSANIHIAGTQWEYLAGLSPAQIQFDRADVGSVNITTGLGVDTLAVYSNSETLFLNSAGGEDVVRLGEDFFIPQDGMDRMTGNITINNSPSHTRLTLTDAFGGAGRNATWTLDGNYTVVTGLQPSGTIRYNNNDTRSVDIVGSNFADTYNFNYVSEVTSVNTGGGVDHLNVNSTEANGLITVHTGAGDDWLTINDDGVGAASATLAATDQLDVLTVINSGRLNLLENANITLFTRISSQSGVIDVANNSFVRRNYAPDYFFYDDTLRKGYNGGLWNGPTASIVSTTAASSAVAGDSVGYAFGSQTTLGSLNGIAINANDLIIRYTLEGDTNLDRVVNFTDLLRLSQNYGQSPRMWSQGNFDYDLARSVAFPDLLKLSQRYGNSLVTANRPMRSNDDDALWKEVIA